MESVNPNLADTTQIALARKTLTLQNQMNSGVDWFFWIAALSMLNSFIYLMGGSMTFVIGLGATQVVDGLASALVPEVSSGTGTIIRFIGLGLDVLIAGVFVVFGVLGRKRFKWGVIIGMILYALDGLIFLVVAEWLGVIFHALALSGLWRGLKAMNELALLEKSQSAGDIATVQKLLSAQQTQAQLAAPRRDRLNVVVVLIVLIAVTLGLLVFVLPAVK